MIGIYDCFGYGTGYDALFEERYRMIKASGFECVMLWWSDKFGRGDGYRKDADLARAAGLQIENMHAPVHMQNALSSDNAEGDEVFNDYLRCIEDSRNNSIPAVVIHLPDDDYELNNNGFRRLETLIGKAEEHGVKIAFENLRNISNLSAVMKRFRSEYVGYCYDSCHHANYAPDVDLLAEYGDRLFALHLHDNGGSHNQHQLPFDGNVAWEQIVKAIKYSDYSGAITLEPMNWDYMNMDMKAFLKLAAERARKLEQMMQMIGNRRQ